MSKPITAALFILLAAAAPQLFAQNFGEITGTVADSSGAVIAGAAVSVTNTATNQVRRTTTNDTGAYSAPVLVPGTYDIRVENTGCKVATRRNVDLQVGAVHGSYFTLKVGAVWEEVEVARRD